MLPKIETILYTTGLSPYAPYVFRYALALASQHRANIVAVHAIEPLTPFGKRLVEHYISPESSAELNTRARETITSQLRERIERLCSKECSNAPNCSNAVASIRVLEGYADQVILNTAQECSADVIVMGARSHSRVGEFMVGSTTRKVLHSARQPVFVVKIPKGHKEELPY